MKWPRDESGRHQICRSCVPIICRGRDLLPVFTWRELCVQHKRCSSNGLFSRGMHCVLFFFPSVWICNDLNRPEGDTMQPVIMWHNGTVWKTAAHISLVSGNDICSVIMEVFARVWPPKKLLYCEFKAFFCFPRDQMQKCSPSRRPRALCCATAFLQLVIFTRDWTLMARRDNETSLWAGKKGDQTWHVAFFFYFCKTCNQPYTQTG